MINIHGYVTGRVQGVGFRFFVKQQAKAHQLNGYAKNLADGRVEFLLQGDDDAAELVLQKIHKGPALSRVDDVCSQTLAEADPYTAFSIA